MKIAITGAGRVGSALARQWAKKGHSIYIGVRDQKKPEILSLVTELGSQTSATSIGEAIAQADVILLSTPWGVTEQIVLEHKHALNGKIIIDCTNPVTNDFKGLTHGHITSAGEKVQEWAPGAKVFKAFNTVTFTLMENPVLEGKALQQFFCGDDQTARPQVRQLVSDAGFEPLDVGPLSTARLLEPCALLWLQSAFVYGVVPADSVFQIVHR